MRTWQRKTWQYGAAMLKGRWTRAVALALALALSTALPAGAISQIFGFRGIGDAYVGVESLMSAQDPFTPNGTNWAAGPVAITQWDQPGGFVEGGNIKHRDYQGAWQRWPYYSYLTNDGVYNFTPYRYISLTPGTYYKYTVYPAGTANQFYVRFCGGATLTQCTTLLNTNMGRGVYNRAGTGGEGSCSAPMQDPQDCPIGFTGSRDNRFLPQWNQANWYTYCYTETHNNVAPQGGAISACGPGPNWDINFR